MTGDNEIAVLLCADQCRVAECSVSAIWGLDPDMPEPYAFQREVMGEAWGGDNVRSFPTEQMALDEAQRQYDDAECVEYGISIYRTELAWCELFVLPGHSLTH
jgi:hypothetical protein